MFKQSNNNPENKFFEFFKTNKQTFIYIGYGLIGIILICLIILIIPAKKGSDNTENSVPEQATTSTTKKQVQPQTEQKLYIKAIDDTWIKVVGDDKKLFENILGKEKTFETKTKTEFIIKIGNIDGVEVYFNDKRVDISKGASNSKVNTITLKRD